MDIETYIKSNYVTACKIQRSITKDEKMKSMLQKGDDNEKLVISWMKDYGLFQGITSIHREKVARNFLSFAKNIDSTIDITNKDTLKSIYSKLYKVLFNTVNRSWMSATSKLLWCIYPDNIVIYDSFVERALVVMQCLDPELSKFPRISVAPKVTRKSDIALATNYYMNYQGMVKNLYERNIKILNELRNKYGETYPHDIRIVDKLLWMIGNPKHKFLNTVINVIK